MNATEDGVEPVGEAPELTAQSQPEPKHFGQQSVWLHFEDRWNEVLVPAQATVCRHLVITPVVGWAEDRGLYFRGTLALTHGPTGAQLAASTYVTGLTELAASLQGFDWEFEEPGHLMKPENAALADAVRGAIRAWQSDDGFSGPVTLWGDDDEKRAAREREPAITLLSEQLDWWPAHLTSIRERQLDNNNSAAWHEGLSNSVHGWGMTYLLAVLHRVAPEVADIAARRLVVEFDAGDRLGEWVFQWSQELKDGNPLTLTGIPDVDPLATFGARA